jgi:hypothetical protein
MLDKSDAERDERRLLDWIGRKGGSVTAREVQQGCRWLKDPGAAETALDELAKTSRGAWQDLPPTAKGGRPARVFAVYAASRLRNPSETRRNEGSVDVDGVDAFENADENATGLIECGTGSGPYQVGF